MEALFAVLCGLLIATGVFLLFSRTVVRVVLGLAFLGYGGNLVILTVAGLGHGAPPLLTLKGPYVDPLPQALILTAIVIGFATTALLLTVALRAYQVAGGGDVRAFGDSLNRDPENPDGVYADPEHPGPDLPESDLPFVEPLPTFTLPEEEHVSDHLPPAEHLHRQEPK